MTVTSPSLASRLRIAADLGNNKGPFSRGIPGNDMDHAKIAFRLRQYVTESFLVVRSVGGHLLDGEDRVEMYDAAHELLCGHLPVEDCSCQAGALCSPQAVAA